MNEKKYFYILFFIVFVIVNFGTGCSTTARSRGDPGAGDYIRPANLDESNYAIRERFNPHASAERDIHPTISLSHNNLED